MRIIKKENGIVVEKSNGTKVNYFFFDEYELHANELPSGVTQEWHHHEKIWETLYIIEGELTVKWKENDIEKAQIVASGDVIESENTLHTIMNHTNNSVRFLVIKQLLKGENYKELFKTDKIVM